MEITIVIINVNHGLIVFIRNRCTQLAYTANFTRLKRI